MRILSSPPARSVDAVRRRGSAIVLVAILAAFLIGLLLLSLDTAHVRLTAQELQRAADAGALAGAEQLGADDGASDFDLTRTHALDCAFANTAARASVQVAKNPSNDPAGDIVVGRWDRLNGRFRATTNEPDAVKVVARRTDTSLGGRLTLFFGAIFGSGESDVQRDAIAHYGAPLDPVLLVLHPTRSGALDMRGNAELWALKGTVHVDSNNGCGIRLNGAPNVPRLRGRKITVTGNYCVPVNSCVPEPLPRQPYIPDPLAGLPYPDPATMVNRGGITGPGTYSPGYYPRGISFNQGTARLLSGVYYLGPPGIDLQGFGYIDGDEVMLFLGPGAKITLAGNGPGMEVSAPDSGIYRGIAIFQHRANTLPCEISGGGNFEVLGTMYYANAHLSMDGNVDRRIGRIIVWTQDLRGDGRYILTGEGPPPDGIRRSFIVE